MVSENTQTLIAWIIIVIIGIALIEGIFYYLDRNNNKCQDLGYEYAKPIRQNDGLKIIAYNCCSLSVNKENIYTTEEDCIKGWVK